MLDLRVYGKIISTPQQSIAEKRDSLFKEFKLCKPFPTLEEERYKLSPSVSLEYKINYDKQLIFNDNESVLDLSESGMTLKTVSDEKPCEALSDNFSYESRLTDRLRDEIIKKYDLDTGEVFAMGVASTEKKFGSVKFEISNIYDEEGESGVPIEDEEPTEEGYTVEGEIDSEEDGSVEEEIDSDEDELTVSDEDSYEDSEDEDLYDEDDYEDVTEDEEDLEEDYEDEEAYEEDFEDEEDLEEDVSGDEEDSYEDDDSYVDTTEEDEDLEEEYEDITDEEGTEEIGVSETSQSEPSPVKPIIKPKFYVPEIEDDDVDSFIEARQEKPIKQNTPVQENTPVARAPSLQAPTDLRSFLRAHPNCKIEEVLKYFSKREVEAEILKGRIIKRNGTLRSL